MDINQLAKEKTDAQRRMSRAAEGDLAVYEQRQRDLVRAAEQQYGVVFQYAEEDSEEGKDQAESVAR